MKKISGFSLPEMLIVISCLLILSVWFLPSQKPRILHAQTDVLKNQLLSAIHYAQQQAQIFGKSVSVCPSSNNRDCTNDWMQGMLVFIDNNEQGKPQDILYKFPKPKVNGKLIFNSARQLKFLSFNPIEDETNNGTFAFYPDKQSQAAFKIIVSDEGRVRVG